MKFYAHLYFQHIPHHYVQMATSEREGGGKVCISLVVKQPISDDSKGKIYFLRGTKLIRILLFSGRKLYI